MGHAHFEEIGLLLIFGPSVSPFLEEVLIYGPRVSLFLERVLIYGPQVSLFLERSIDGGVHGGVHGGVDGGVENPWWGRVRLEAGPTQHPKRILDTNMSSHA